MHFRINDRHTLSSCGRPGRMGRFQRGDRGAREARGPHAGNPPPAPGGYADPRWALGYRLRRREDPGCWTVKGDRGTAGFIEGVEFACPGDQVFEPRKTAAHCRKTQFMLSHDPQRWWLMTEDRHSAAQIRRRDPFHERRSARRFEHTMKSPSHSRSRRDGKSRNRPSRFRQNAVRQPSFSA